MQSVDGTTDLGIADRIRRSGGRRGRVISANAKVTRDEHNELEAAAKREGKALGEWAREVLLSAARRRQTDIPVFTEVVALRMLMSTVLRNVALGDKMTAETYAQVLNEVRTQKHNGAKDMLAQYQNPTGDK